MIPNDQWVQVVAKLIEMTQKAELKWKAEPSIKASDAPIGLLMSNSTAPGFTSGYKDKRLRIRPYQLTPYSITLRKPSATHLLEIMDDAGQSVWQFPDVPGIRDLFETIRFQQAGVKEFLDDILKK